ncbi:MAG: hypothetical protein PHY02_10265 [Phycisphaerae bacterium]|nr:hypothetical protein [Phycisphaerae bacterium]
MKDKLSTRRAYRLSILMTFILISVILTSYSMYANKQQQIDKQQKQIDEITHKEMPKQRATPMPHK